MNKIEFRSKDVDNHELFEELSKDPIVIKLFKDKKLNPQLLMKFPYKFKRYRDNIRKCLECKGLSYCQQNIEGKYLDIEFDGMLIEVYRDCKYLKNYLQKVQHLSNYYQCDITKDNLDIEFKKINIEKESDEYLLVLQQVINLCHDYDNLYLYGTMGSGKSYLATCGCNYYAFKNKKVAFIHVPTFSSKIKGMQFNEINDLVSELKRAYFLVLDDLGAEKESAWFRDDILLPILNHRMDSHLCTWFTSNHDLDSLEHYYTMIDGDQLKAHRLMERVKNSTKCIELSTENRRKNC